MAITYDSATGELKEDGRVTMTVKNPDGDGKVVHTLSEDTTWRKDLAQKELLKKQGLAQSARDEAAGLRARAVILDGAASDEDAKGAFWTEQIRRYP